jgi:hypothetical protein
MLIMVMLKTKRTIFRMKNIVPKALRCGIRKGSGIACLYKISTVNHSKSRIQIKGYIHYISNPTRSHSHRKPRPRKMFNPLLPSYRPQSLNILFNCNLALLLYIMKVLTISFPLFESLAPFSVIHSWSTKLNMTYSRYGRRGIETTAMRREVMSCRRENIRHFRIEYMNNNCVVKENGRVVVYLFPWTFIPRYVDC